MTVKWGGRAREVFTGNPARMIQSAIGGGAVLVALYLLVKTDADRPLAWSMVIFGIYTLGRTALNALVATVSDQDKRTSPVLADEVVTANQTAVTVLIGTTLGILTAFTNGRLPDATRAAVVALVAAALVQFAVQASGARKLGARAWNIGLVGDVVAFSLLSFGLISLAAALVTRSGS